MATKLCKIAFRKTTRAMHFVKKTKLDCAMHLYRESQYNRVQSLKNEQGYFFKDIKSKIKSPRRGEKAIFSR